MQRSYLALSSRQSAGRIGTVKRLLLSLPVLSVGLFAASTAIAQTMNPAPQPAAPTEATPGLNPCPNVYYEEPFNSTRVVPQGCPANDATLREQQGQPSQPYSPTSAGQPPVAGSTANSEALNPCPAIYYEEPFNSTRIVPQGCPANAATMNQ